MFSYNILGSILSYILLGSSVKVYFLIITIIGVMGTCLIIFKLPDPIEAKNYKKEYRD